MRDRQTASKPAASRAVGADRAVSRRKAPDAAPAPSIRPIRVKCLVNAHYHAAREAFLDGVHRWLMFGVIATGAAAVSTLAGIGPSWLNPAFGAVAAILGALDLAFDLASRARKHSVMKRRYFELLADVEEGRITIVQADVCLLRYSSEEEPAYHALLLACWNATQEMVYGARVDQYEIPRLHRFCQHLRRYEGASARYKFKAGDDASRASAESASPSA